VEEICAQRVLAIVIASTDFTTIFTQDHHEYNTSTDAGVGGKSSIFRAQCTTKHHECSEVQCDLNMELLPPTPESVEALCS
jgi:hypothetical protein